MPSFNLQEYYANGILEVDYRMWAYEHRNSLNCRIYFRKLHDEITFKNINVYKTLSVWFYAYGIYL